MSSVLLKRERCNMPHVNPKAYPRAPKEYKLEYVEVVSDIGHIPSMHPKDRRDGLRFFFEQAL